VTSLRGPEGRLLDLEGMWAQKGVHLDSTVLALVGKVKGETDSPCVHITSSVVNLKEWMNMCLLANQEEGHLDGPAVSNAAGFVLTASKIDEMFHNALIQSWRSCLICFPQTFKHQKISRPTFNRSDHSAAHLMLEPSIKLFPRFLWTRSTD
jgi:hypothetical protein